ncbi:MAG: sugar-binding protein [Armatimonadota bacterium]
MRTLCCPRVHSASVMLLAALLIVTAGTTALCQTLVSARASEPAAIDARAVDDCWENAMVATDFSVLGSAGVERAFRQTTVRTAWDDSALYFHVICLEPTPESITADVTSRDGQTWMEDAVEVFLQPDPESGTYLHFIINARGVVYDEHGTDGSYDADVRVAAEIGEQAWMLEMAIPWSDLADRAPRSGELWGFNVGRRHRPVEPTEWSTWAPLEQGLYKFPIPEKFGRLRFTAAPLDDGPPMADGPRILDGLDLPAALLENPSLRPAEDGSVPGWRLSEHTTHHEIAPMSRHRALRNDGDYGIASQRLAVPVEAGDIFTVISVVRAGEGARAGIAVVQEMEDGSPDDLYPYFRLDVGDDYELQVGRIVVDEGAKRLRSANLYRANKTGWVEYAYAQVFRGAIGLGGIFEAIKCTGEDERGFGEPWETPALSPWRPLPDGPVRALVFVGEYQRDAVELAQRVDLDYDVVYCPTYRGSGKVDQSVAFDATDIERRLRGGDYDVIVLAGRPSEPSVISAIISAVERGAGLIAVQPLAGGDAARPAQLARLLDRLPDEALTGEALADVLGALDPEVLTQTTGTRMLQSLAVGSMGEGRVARLAWSDNVSGLVPFREGTNEYWEYRWAALSRALVWAAGRTPASRITDLTFDADGLTVALESPRPETLTLQITWDHRFEVGERFERRITPGDGGTAELTVPAQELPRGRRGPTVARVALLSDGRPLDFAAATVPGVEPQISLGELALPETADPGEEVEVGVAYSAEAQGTLRVELVDAFCRVISRAERTLEEGSDGTEQFTLTVREPLSVYHRAVASALDGERLADRVERPVFVPRANADHLARFRLAVGYAAMHIRCAPWLETHLVDFFRAHGVEAATVNEYMIERGMPAFGGVARAGIRNTASGNVREPCVSNPERLREIVDRTVENIGNDRRWGFLGFNMDDETHLSQRGDVEVCGSEHCVAAFREWAAGQYESISAANTEWGTDFASFDDVPMPLASEMKGADNPALWVDYRLHMDRVWAEMYATVHDEVRERYPAVRMSFTNPYKYNSLSGTNFAQWVPYEEILLRYSHRHVADRDMSWSDAPVLSWFGYRTGAEGCSHFVWRFALNGGVMPIWWDPIEPWAYSSRGPGFTPWYMFGPLWRETGRSRAVTEAVAELTGGVGRLLRLVEHSPPQAAILHSQASKHAVYAFSALEAGHPTDSGWERYHASDDAMAEMLIRHGLAYRYVLPEELDGEAMRGVELLVLPSCVALSDETVEAIQRFVADGGKVVADVMPATHSGHGRPRETATPLASLAESGEMFVLGEYASEETADVLDAGIAAVGFTPTIRWERADGGLPREARLFRFKLGAAEYLSVLRGSGTEAAEEGPLSIRLPRSAWVYDVRTGEEFGRRDELEVDPGPGEACFLALLPYQPEDLRASATQVDDHLVVKAEVSAALTPTDHVLRISVTPAGEGRPRYEYDRQVKAERGRAELAVPPALSDPAGAWTIVVRDVATGLAAEAEAAVVHLP